MSDAGAIAQARRIIHDNDVERLKQLLVDYPALLSWQDDERDGGLLGFATGAYGDAGDPDREQWFTRAACAELLIDAGAVVMPSVCERLLQSRARGLLKLFQRKGLLPRTLKFFAALGDLDAVRAALDENGSDLAAVNEAFICTCRFGHEAVALLLLERAIALDPELGAQMDATVGRPAFVMYFIEKHPSHATSVGPWKAFVMEQISRAVVDGDLTAFVTGLQHEPWLLGEHAPHSIAHPHLAIAGRSAPRGGDGRSLTGEALVRRGGEGCAGRPGESGSRDQRSPTGTSMGRGGCAAGPRHRARLVRHQPALQRGGLPSRTRRRHQHQLELARAGEHPAPSCLLWEPRVDAIPHRPWHRHDHQGLPLEQYRAGLGALRQE